MSRAPPVVIIHNIDGIVRSVNNGDLTARLVWVDPAANRDNFIKCTLSDQTRSIRLMMWGYDLETKKFLTENMMKIFCWTGLTARLTKNDPSLQREHLFSLSLNENDDKFKMGFVGRFQIVEGCTIPFLDIVMPRPELMSQTPLISPSRSQDMKSTTMPVLVEKRGREDAISVPKRERDDDEAPAWICPVNGCRLPDYPYCMMTGSLHPAVCALCGTQGQFQFCPAAPRGVKIVHSDMIATTKEITPAETQKGTLTFGLSADVIDSMSCHASKAKDLLGSIPMTVDSASSRHDAIVKELLGSIPTAEEELKNNAAGEESKADTSTVEKATTDDATADKALSGEESKADKGTTDKATDDKATADNGEDNKAGTTDKATYDKATYDTPKAGKTTDDQATADKATADKVKANTTTADKATADKATADNAAAKKAAAEKAAAEKAAAEKTAAEKVKADKAAAEKVAADKAAAEKAAAENKAVADKAAAEKVKADKAAAEKAAPVKNAAETVKKNTAPQSKH